MIAGFDALELFKWAILLIVILLAGNDIDTIIKNRHKEKMTQFQLKSRELDIAEWDAKRAAGVVGAGAGATPLGKLSESFDNLSKWANRGLSTNASGDLLATDNDTGAIFNITKSEGAKPVAGVVGGPYTYEQYKKDSKARYGNGPIEGKAQVTNVPVDEVEGFGEPAVDAKPVAGKDLLQEAVKPTFRPGEPVRRVNKPESFA